MSATRTIAAGLTIAATALTPAVALAKHGADDAPGSDDHGGQRTGTTTVRRDTGDCTRNSSAKLKVKPDDGRLEVEFEVDQNRNGVAWNVMLRRNGTLAVSTTATTKAPSGSFSVERRLTDGSGSDRISARATSPTGEVCTASLTI